jgi:hypothetical protein
MARGGGAAERQFRQDAVLVSCRTDSSMSPALLHRLQVQLCPHHDGSGPTAGRPALPSAPSGVRRRGGERPMDRALVVYESVFGDAKQIAPAIVGAWRGQLEEDGP